MNDEDRYLFDLQGYLAIPGALSPGQLTQLNTAIDEGIAHEAAPDMRTHRFGDLLGRAPVFRELIDNPTVVPVLEAMLGHDFRLDHTYADVIRAGDGPIGTVLHGGAIPYRPAEYYFVDSHGIIHSGLVAVAFNLKDVGPEDGGFACVPGSHKSAFPFPKNWKQLANRHPSVRRVTGPAGTVIIFTEALVHGTLPWTGADERRTAFYKYSPPALSWSAEYYDPSEYADLTPRQAQILESPNARYGGRATAPR